jgi:hypothetical protein
MGLSDARIASPAFLRGNSLRNSQLVSKRARKRAALARAAARSAQCAQWGSQARCADLATSTGVLWLGDFMSGWACVVRCPPYPSLRLLLEDRDTFALRSDSKGLGLR